MKLNPKNLLFGNDEGKKGPVLLAVTPPRTGERTLLGVENLLQSIAVPEPFSLELAGDMDGVTLMARCLDAQVVRGQLSAHYPQARIQQVDPDDDPLRLEEGEQAWSVARRATLHTPRGPERRDRRTEGRGIRAEGRNGGIRAAFARTLASYHCSQERT